MKAFFAKIIKQTANVELLPQPQLIQELWSGYGQILRYTFPHTSLVVKNVRLPENDYHPRGWNTNLSHQRKVKSYEIEMAFYSQFARRCDDNCRIPHCLAMETSGDEVLLIMEDLNTAGFPKRITSVNWNQVQACLQWLANFHAEFLHEEPKNLWPTGCYWHLETRPEELQCLSDQKLKQAAGKLDQILASSPFQTFVHGDAKLANFCFSADGKNVSAVDFQYVGGGCGMKDVAYFVGSCLYEEDCERLESEILDSYFDELKKALKRKKSTTDVVALEKNWRELYHVAWTDFHRFLKGWSPGHWKINSYSERVTREVLTKLDQYEIN